MLTFKRIISVLAALLVTFAACAAGGLFAPTLMLSAATVATLQAVAQGVGIFGVSVYQFPTDVAKGLSWAGGLMAIIQVGHAGAVAAHAPHSGWWVAFGCVGVLVSNLGKSPLPHPPPATP